MRRPDLGTVSRSTRSLPTRESRRQRHRHGAVGCRSRIRRDRRRRQRTPTARRPAAAVHRRGDRGSLPERAVLRLRAAGRPGGPQPRRRSPRPRDDAPITHGLLDHQAGDLDDDCEPGGAYSASSCCSRWWLSRRDACGSVWPDACPAFRVDRRWWTELGRGLGAGALLMLGALAVALTLGLVTSLTSSWRPRPALRRHPPARPELDHHCPFGLLCGTAYLLTGELALPIGLPLAWNYLQGLVFGVTGTGSAYGSVLVLAPGDGSASRWTGLPYGVEAGMLGTIAVATGLALLVAWKGSPWRRVAGAGAGNQSTPHDDRPHGTRPRNRSGSLARSGG